MNRRARGLGTMVLSSASCGIGQNGPASGYLLASRREVARDAAPNDVGHTAADEVESSSERHGLYDGSAVTGPDGLAAYVGSVVDYPHPEDASESEGERVRSAGGRARCPERPRGITGLCWPRPRTGTTSSPGERSGEARRARHGAKSSGVTSSRNLGKLTISSASTPVSQGSDSPRSPVCASSRGTSMVTAHREARTIASPG